MHDPTAGFDSPFFASIRERSVVSILNHEGRLRDYTFPTFFADTKATMVLFTANAKKCEALLGDLPFTPVRVGWNRCLFTIAAFHYGRLSDGMKSYHEWAFGVGVDTSGVPLLPLVFRSSWSSFGVWVLDLPVDSLENCRRGTEIWGLPKTMKRFGSAQSATEETMSLFDGDSLACEVTVPLAGSTSTLSETNRALARKGERIFRSETRMEGACTWFTGLHPRATEVRVKWGETEPYRTFANLDLSPRPLLVRRFDALSTALFAPTELPNP